MPFRKWSCLLFVLWLVLAVGCATTPDVKPGEPAIPFTALAVDGKPVSLEDFKGRKNVVLVFYISHT